MSSKYLNRLCRHYLKFCSFDDVQLSLTSAEIFLGDKRAVVNVSPFSVEFYANDVLTLVIEGDRLTLENVSYMDNSSMSKVKS